MLGGNGENDDIDPDVDLDDEIDDDEDLDDDAMPDIGGETVIDLTGELENELAANSGKVDPVELAHRREVKRRLEELAEKRSQDLDDTFNFNLDDDL